MCLRLAFIVLAFASLAKCAEDTSVCRQQISTQKGRKFLVTFSTFDHANDFKCMIYIASHSSGNVSITKHIGNSSTTDVRNISPGINEVSISPSSLVQTSAGKQTKVLRIESTFDIAVYMTGFKWGIAAAYTVFPESTWAKEYVIPTFEPAVSGRNNTAIVSSLQGNTSLHISNTKLNYFINTSIQKDESFAIVKVEDISQTIVQSDKPVSVVSENKCASVPANYSGCDTMLDSPIPVEYWVSEFIIPPLTPKLGYLVRVFAQESNMTVNILLKNRTQSINQTFTGMFEVLLGTDAAVIKTDRKVNVVQYGLTNTYDFLSGDPFMTSVPGIQHYGNNYLIPSPFESEGFLNTIAITIRRKHLDGVLFDGRPLDLQTANVITPVTPYDDFRIVSLNLTGGNHSLSHPSADARFSVLLYGRYSPNGFGFYLGYTFHKDEVCQNGGTCINNGWCQCLVAYIGVKCEFAIATTAAPISNTMCFACEDASAPSFCDAIELCQTNEICFLERYSSAEGHLRYRSGCKKRQICSEYSKTIGELHGETCLQCCEGSFCNSRGCGDKGFPPRESRGPLCLDCAHVRDPKYCDQTTLCSSDEICYIEEMKWGDESLFHLGCRSSYQCAFEARSLTSRSVPMCQACCHDDFCNRNCTRQNQDKQQAIVG